MSASSRSSPSDAGFPTHGNPRDKMIYAVKYAMLAPAEIDWQPWEFQVTDSHIELRARNDPTLNALDPDGRELMIGCGSASVYLKLALRHFGCLGRVELFPSLDQPRLAARIHFGCQGERDALDRRLFDAMTRLPVKPPAQEGTPLPESMLSAVSRVLDRDRGWIEFAHSEISRQRLMQFLPANRPQSGNPDSAATWALAAGNSEPPGVGARGTPRSLFMFRARRADPVAIAEPMEPLPALPSATLAVVKTKTDDKHGWLAAGHAMARIILQAQALGMSWGFFNQPVRRRHAREALRLQIGHKGFAQVILQLACVATEHVLHPDHLTVGSAAPQW